METTEKHGFRSLEPLTARTLHVAIDVQRLFAEPTDWHVPGLRGIVPAIARLAQARPARTLCARFVPPASPEAAEGRWRSYYARWASVTGERLDPSGLDLLAPLDSGITVFDKGTYSIFGAPDFLRRLAAEPVDTLVMTGVETDVCVLSSLFDAVDRGYRVVVPADAVASSSPEAHAAVLDHLLPRLSEQVDVTTVEDVLRAWPA